MVLPKHNYYLYVMNLITDTTVYTTCLPVHFVFTECSFGVH